MPLRNYQQSLYNGIYKAWDTGARNVLATCATGGGKTVIFSEVLKEHVNREKWCVAIAHRQELVLQMSVALARNGVYHHVEGNPKLITLAAWLHMSDPDIGQSYIRTGARCVLVGVRTLNRRRDSLKPLLERAALWVMDEAHHILQGNEWGRAVEMMPNAHGLGVTATAGRSDGKGLGRHADGVMDVIVEGPDAGMLMREGWLTGYRVFCPKSKIDLVDVAVSKATGDYVSKQLADALDRSEITGDIVNAYQRFIPGKLTAVFVTHVALGVETVKRLRDAGISAEFLCGDTPDDVRVEVLRRFKAGDVRVLVNVDLFGEGFDLPALEAVIFARPTESLPLFLQHCGRVLRLMLRERPDDTSAAARHAQIAASEKPTAYIVDLVGNYIKHLPPERPRKWSLDRTAARSRTDDDDIPMIVCAACLEPYTGVKRKCPHCGFQPVPVERSQPAFVDGDILELDDDARAALIGEIEQDNMSFAEYEQELIARQVPTLGRKRMQRLRRERVEAHGLLRAIIDMWGSIRHPDVDDVQELYRKFYHTFGLDVLTAQTLSTDETMSLGNRIAIDIGRVQYENNI